MTIKLSAYQQAGVGALFYLEGEVVCVVQDGVAFKDVFSQAIGPSPPPSLTTVNISALSVLLSSATSTVS
jgi:hypothetical protein